MAFQSARVPLALTLHISFSYTFSILLSVLYLQSQWRGLEAFDSEKAIQSLAAHDEETTPYMHPASIRYASSRPPSLVSSSRHSPSRPPSPPQRSIRSATPSYRSRISDRLSEWAEAGLRGDSPGDDNSRTPALSSRTQSVSSQSCSTWVATTLVSDADSIRSGISLPDSASIISGGSLPPAPVPGSSAHAPQRRWSSSTSSSYNANAALVTDGFRPGLDLPSYSSRPGSLYHETMKYEAGLKFQNCGPFP